MTRQPGEARYSALELAIEEAYCTLHRQPREVWLTAEGRLIRSQAAHIASGDVELVGSYTLRVRFQQFREDVFEAFEILRKRGAHAR